MYISESSKSKKATSSVPLVQIVTLGCAKNEVDSDKMRVSLLNAGFEVIGADELSDRFADVIVVNTCSFITEATQESIDTILSIADDIANINDLDRVSSPKLVVTGCMPSRYGDELYEELSEVDAFLSAVEEQKIAEVVEQLTGFDANAVKSSAVNDPRTAKDNAPTDNSAIKDDVASAQSSEILVTPKRAYNTKVHDNRVQIESTQRTLSSPWAYVKISDGCSSNCTYCTIPRIRGAYRSRPAGDIVKEIDGLVGQGCKEIILIGQDTGIWGRDLTDDPSALEISQISNSKLQFGTEKLQLTKTTLATLMDFLATHYPDVWFRVMYLQPKGVTDDLLGVMSLHKNICPYLDIPLQHCSKRVLKDMNRQGSAEEYLQLLDRIRASLGDCTIRTTFIAGFPGETDQESQELASFVEQAHFDFAGVFEYSQEDGTLAGEREDQIDTEVIIDRANAIREVADISGLELAESRVGQTLDVLICDIDAELSTEQESIVWGRSMFQAPDVDSIVFLPGSADLIGQRVRVKIVDCAAYDLEGRIASD